MKTGWKCLFCVVLALLLAACRDTGGMDLSLFLERWNRQSATTLSLDDFYLTAQPERSDCFAVLDECLLLRLSGGETQIDAVRLILSKLQPDGQARSLSGTDRTAFCAAANALLGAYCALSPQQTEELLHTLLPQEDAAFFREGERTADVGDFHFVYLSAPLECVLIVQNRRLRPVVSTSKPEEKPAFDQTTQTRKETVPHK